MIFRSPTTFLLLIPALVLVWLLRGTFSRMALVLRGPASEPELRNLIGELSKAVDKGIQQGRLAGDAWTRRQEAFHELLAVPEATLAWRYLNKGTHAGDGEDFEIGIVQQIIAALAKLSASFTPQA